MTGVPGRTRVGVRRGEQRRVAIVDAACELVAERGSVGMTLADVAAAAGVTRSGLLHHFTSKDVLLDAVFDRHLETEDLTPAEVAELSPLASMRALTRVAQIDIADRRRALLWNVIVTEGLREASTFRRRLLEYYATLRAVAGGMIQRAVDDGDFREDVDVDREAVALIAVVRGLETSWLIDDTIPLAELVSAQVEAFIARLSA